MKHLFCRSLAGIALIAGVAGCGTTGRHEERRTDIMLDALYAHYAAPKTKLLRENYPDDASYEATYLAETAGGNAYSYLWPFSGTLSAAAALVEARGWERCGALVDTAVLPGLEEYADYERVPFAYASYIREAPASDRFYDDNIWLGIDFADLYAASGQPRFLEGAESVWRFVESGTDERLGDGIYWCEQRKESKHACSNAPGAVLALKLYAATDDEAYLERGRALYAWTRAKLLDPEDDLYYDNIRLDGTLGKAKFSYNSGQMIQAGALLHRLTGERHYLDEARRTARSCLEHFFETAVTPQGDSIRLLRGDMIWFDAVMLRGMIELAREDAATDYLTPFRQSIDYAWEHARDGQGLLSDWKGARRDARKWLLAQAAFVEMLARMEAIENTEK